MLARATHKCISIGENQYPVQPARWNADPFAQRACRRTHQKHLHVYHGSPRSDTYSGHNILISSQLMKRGVKQDRTIYPDCHFFEVWSGVSVVCLYQCPALLAHLVSHLNGPEPSLMLSGASVLFLLCQVRTSAARKVYSGVLGRNGLIAANCVRWEKNTQCSCGLQQLQEATDSKSVSPEQTAVVKHSLQGRAGSALAKLVLGNACFGHFSSCTKCFMVGSLMKVASGHCVGKKAPDSCTTQRAR